MTIIISIIIKDDNNNDKNDNYEDYINNIHTDNNNTIIKMLIRVIRKKLSLKKNLNSKLGILYRTFLRLYSFLPLLH